VLAAECVLELGILHELAEPLEGGAEVALDVLAGLRPLDQDPGIVLFLVEADT
jgi:hypothetical protein